jgi:hypothetical protein
MQQLFTHNDETKKTEVNNKLNENT